MAETTVTDTPRQLEGVDTLSFRVFQSFMRATQLHKQLMVKAIAEKGGHMGSAGVLRVLESRDGMSQRDLADLLHLSRPTVTGILQTMEKAGLIARRRDEKDQRLTRVYLTDEGRAMNERLRRVLADYINETFAPLSETDRRELEQLLDRLAENTERSLHAHAASTPEEEA